MLPLLQGLQSIGILNKVTYRYEDEEKVYVVIEFLTGETNAEKMEDFQSHVGLEDIGEVKQVVRQKYEQQLCNIINVSSTNIFQNKVSCLSFDISQRTKG